MEATTKPLEHGENRRFGFSQQQAEREIASTVETKRQSRKAKAARIPALQKDLLFV
jgi:hypothetical protein